jgi:hypothetical protein
MLTAKTARTAKETTYQLMRTAPPTFAVLETFAHFRFVFDK